MNDPVYQHKIRIVNFTAYLNNLDVNESCLLILTDITHLKIVRKVPKCLVVLLAFIKSDG